MDKKKSLAWSDARIPGFALADERTDLVREFTAALVEATELTAYELASCVKSALFQSAENAGGDFSDVKLELWSATERAFYEGINQLASDALDQAAAESLGDTLTRDFLFVLSSNAEAIFARWCPTAGLAPQVMRRHIAARYQLSSTLRGYGKLGAKLYERLRVPAPESRPKPAADDTGSDASTKKTRAKSATKAATKKANPSARRKPK